MTLDGSRQGDPILRLVDGLLGEAAGHETGPDVAERVARRLDDAAAASRWQRRAWSTAALLMLGLGAIGWIAVASRDAAEEPPVDPAAVDPADVDPADADPADVAPPGVDEPQDPVKPDPLPPALQILDLSEAPDDARNVRLEVVGDGEGWFEGMRRLTRLERLELGDARSSPARHVAKPRRSETILPDAFEPLAVCERVHTIGFRGLSGVQARHVASLRSLPVLRALRFDSSGERLDLELAEAVAALPHLETLVLRGSRVTPEGLDRLARIDSLRDLRLRATPGLDAKGMSAIASMTHLRALSLQQIDNAMNMLTGRGAPTGFDLLDPAFLESLPALDSLDLSENLISPERVAAVPKSLRHLSLRECHGLENGIDGFAEALLALPELRELEFDAAMRPAEYARLANPKAPEIDPELRILTRLLGDRLFTGLAIGRVPQEDGALAEALATQSTLRELRITWSMSRGENVERLDLAFAAHLARLEVLTLDVHRGQAAMRLDALDFSPLAGLPKLRRLVLPGWRGRHLQRARAALSDGVDVDG